MTKITNLEHYKKEILNVLINSYSNSFKKGCKEYTFIDAVEKCMGEKLPDYPKEDLWITIINWLCEEYKGDKNE